MKKKRSRKSKLAFTERMTSRKGISLAPSRRFQTPLLTMEDVDDDDDRDDDDNDKNNTRTIKTSNPPCHQDSTSPGAKCVCVT